MRTNARQLLDTILQEVAADVRRHVGEEARGSLLQQMVAEVQARTGTTVPLSLVEAWFDAAQPQPSDAADAEAEDPWDRIDERLDAERVV